MTSVPFYDLTRQQRRIRRELLEAADRVLESGRFILGPEVSTFEASVAEVLGVRHAVGVSSGSDALVLALLALGVGAGDVVMTTAFSFFATAEAILRVGATPKFVDVERESLNMDPDELERRFTAQTKAVLVVHLYGAPAKIDRIVDIAARHGVPVVEDAAQAFGASHEGRAVGGWGALGCFSFFPTKILGGLGDGGMVVTNEPNLGERCRSLRQHGATTSHEHREIGGNYRLDALQAAFLSVKLRHLRESVDARRRHAEAYDRGFEEFAGVQPVALKRAPGSVVSSYTVRVAASFRDRLRAQLKELGIETAIYYPRPLPAQPVFRETYDPDDFREAASAAQEVLSLPLFPELTVQERDFVIDKVRELFRSAR